jgi:methionine-S-sulfoxide reductase
MKDKIYLAGGCFWGVQAFFDKVNGVVKTKVGYAQGTTENPTYDKVCRGEGSFTETVEVEYDNQITSLEKIIDLFFTIIDPTSINKQGGDIGIQYRTGIYTEKEEIIKQVEKYFESKQKHYNSKIVVENQKLINFFKAEEYHQKYLEKNPGGYCHINLGICKGPDFK